MTARDPVAAARALLEKAEIAPGLELAAVPLGDYRVSIRGESPNGGFLLCRVQFDAPASEAALGLCDLFAAAPALLGELVAVVERLRRDKNAAWEVIRSVKAERDRAISHAVYSSDPAAIPLGKAIERVALGTGLDLEIVEDACLTAPTAEAIAELRGNPTGLPEGEADWRDHPAIEPDPAEAAQAEERARIEALAREEEARAKEEGRREAFNDAIDRWHDGAGEGKELHEYLGLTWEQYARFVSAGEAPEGWEPPAGLAGEGEVP